MKRRVLSLALGSFLLATCLFLPGHQASAEGRSAGETTLHLSLAISKALFSSGVTVYAASPATGSLDQDGSLILRLPGSGDKDRGAASALAGGLLFSRSETQGGVIFERLVIDASQGLVTARVSGTAGAWGKTMPVFRLADLRQMSSKRTYAYTVKLTPVAARTLNASLGVSSFSPGMTLGQGRTLL